MISAPFTYDPDRKPRRLSWPGGAVPVKASSHIACWGNRYAAISSEQSAWLAIIDAETGRQARLEGDVLLEYGWRIAVIGDELVLATFDDEDDDDVLRLSLAALAAVVASDLHTTQIDRDGTRHTTKVVRGKARDPLANDGVLAPIARRPDVERLIAQIAEAPDDDQHRAVFVDLLQDVGEPYGHWLAQERSANPPNVSPARRREALGPLGLYLKDVVYRGGLPWGASTGAGPNDEAFEAQACSDLRLGLFHELRLVAGGSFPLYAKLVTSPCAIGLRRVDVSQSWVIERIIGARRDQFTTLVEPRFHQRDELELLADPVFDRASSVVASFFSAKALDNLRADRGGFIGRVPRRLVAYPEHASPFGLDDLLPAWQASPFVELTIGPLTARREGAAIVITLAPKRLDRDTWIDHAKRATPDAVVRN